MTMTPTASRPPLVKSAPLIGSMRPFMGDILPFLTECRATYGDAVRLKMLNVEMTCLFGEEAIALLRRGSVLHTAESLGVLSSQMHSRLPEFNEGPNHQAMRRAHHQFMTNSLESARRHEIQTWLEMHTARWHPGTTLHVLHESQAQTVDVLSRLLNDEPFPFASKDLATVVHSLIWATFGHAPKAVLWNPRYRLAIRRMRIHLLDLVRRLRADPERAARTLVGNYLSSEPYPEIGTWDDRDLVAAPLGVYLAGFDTLASASSFLLYQLLSNPDALDEVRREYARLVDEEDGPVDPMKQTFMRAAFHETTRINPPGSTVLRVAQEDFEFAGHLIRKGDEVLVAIASDHLNEEHFPDPGRFDPSRFLGPDGAELRRRVLPFGSGAHRCTGSALGELIAVETVSHWVNHFDLRVTHGRRPVSAVARPFTQPKGLRVEVLGRRDHRKRGEAALGPQPS